MSGSRTGAMSSFVVLAAAAGVLTTIQAGLIIALHRKCVKLANQLSELRQQNTQNSDSICTMKREINDLRISISQLERRTQKSSKAVSFGADASTESVNGNSCPKPVDSQQQQRISRTDSLTSVSEGEYADAVDDPGFLRNGSDGSKVETANEMTMNDNQNQQGLNSLLADVDQLHENGSHREAYEKLVQANNDSDPEILWRLARVCHQIASPLAKEDARKKELLDEAHKYANSAYEMSADDFNVLKWNAAVTGSRTDFLGVKERIEQGNLFKALLDKALAINPEESSLLHMRGRFSYSVAGLSWIERKAASTLFAAPPKATYDDAINDFLAVMRLKADWLDNLVYLAKSYLAKGDKQNAVIYLEKAIHSTVQAENGEEPELMKEARTLLEKHRK